MRGRNTDRHIRGYWGTSTQSEPTAGTAWTAPIHSLDDRHGARCCGHHHCCKSHQMDESQDQPQPADATPSRHGLWMHQRYPIRPFPACRQVRCGATRPNDCRQTQPIQSMAIVDHTSHSSRSCTLSALLPPPRVEALFHQHTIPLCFLRVQHHCHSGRPYLFPADISPFTSSRSLSRCLLSH